MIKINLASRKQASGVEGKPAKASGAGLSSLNFSFLKGFPIRKIAIPVIAALTANYLLDGYKEDELKKMDEQVAKLAAETAKLQVEVGKIKNYDPIKKSLDQDEMVLKTKLDTIRQLLADRGSSTKMLVSIAHAIPNEVWMTYFRVNSKGVSIKGGSLGFNQISDFMKNLADNAVFSDLELKDSAQSKLDQTEVATFELIGKRR